MSSYWRIETINVESYHEQCLLIIVILGGCFLSFDLLVQDYSLFFLGVWLTSLARWFLSSIFCRARFLARFCLNLVFEISYFFPIVLTVLLSIVVWVGFCGFRVYRTRSSPFFFLESPLRSQVLS